jgi:formamidopyrimidine-DNA glycosylase
LPELPEVRIVADYINLELNKHEVLRVEKNPDSKNKCDLSILEGKTWRLRAVARGKELAIIFNSGEEKHPMKITFGRIGSIEKVPIDMIKDSDVQKRALLRFYTKDYLFFISDLTRMTLWRWCGIWDATRSPDPLFEHNQWRTHIYNKRKCVKYKKTTFMIMMDQRHFNGIGNYTRSEILYRVSFSPFIPFTEVLKSDVFREEFFRATKEVLQNVYEFGGFQFKKWRNPFGVSKQKINAVSKCYNNNSRCMFTSDEEQRFFWFRHEWADAFYEWIDDEDKLQDTRLIKKIYRIKRKWLLP